MNEESHPEPPAQPAETPQESQPIHRHWLSQVAEHAADGSAAAAAGYATKKVLDKVFGGWDQEKGDGSAPPSDSPPVQSE